MATACEECTQNCLMMHKELKDPNRVTTTFFKVMFGENYSKVLFLPPRIARSEQHMIGKRTELVDLNGEKWKVTFTKVDGVLAFEEGWDKFASAHSLKIGDFLVFHYIRKSHFVVLMYGPSGCPENRHFGFPHRQKKVSKKKNNLIIGHSPSNLNTNESSSQSGHLVHEVNDKEMTKNNGNDAKMPLLASSSQPGTSGSYKETGQGSKPFVRNTSSDNMVSEMPTATLKPFSLLDIDNGHVQDECTKNGLHPDVVESDVGRENKMMASGGGSDETQSDEQQKISKTKKMAAEGLKGSPGMQSEQRKISKTSSDNKVSQSPTTHGNISKKRFTNTHVQSTPRKHVKKEFETSGSRFHNDGYPFTSTGTFSKSMDKWMEATKKEPTTNHGLDVLIKKEPKPEPVEYDESPPAGSSNASFSVVVSSYQYLELPDGVKLPKSNKVILLRNGHDLWPVFYQAKYGLKALTQCWGVFAKERGIKLGDKCQFVPESEPTTRNTCDVYSVMLFTNN